MALARYRGVATDESGNTLASPTVEVRRESDNGLASLFSDRNGTTGIGNSFTGNADGTFDFHVVGGAYKITITQGLNTRTLRYVAIGTMAEHDDTDLIDARLLYYDVKEDFGALGDSSTDDTAAIQDALDTVPAGATLFFPEGLYIILGSGSSALTRTLPINIVGAGFGSTGFSTHASFPNTRDVLTFNSSLTPYQGIHISDFGFYMQSRGRNGLVIDASSGNLIHGVHIHDCYFTEPNASQAIKFNGNVAYSTIERCNVAGILLESTGDGVTIRENVIGGAKHCIEASFTQGAGGFVVLGNVIAGTAGHVVIRDFASGPVIAFNEFETPISVANTHGFLVDIGSTNSPVTATLGVVLLRNQYSVLSGTSNPIPIRIRSGVERALIQEARLFNQSGVHIQIDSGATDAKVDDNVLAYTGVNSVKVSVSNSGARTVAFAQHNATYLGGYLLAVDLNSANTDNALTITLPTGITRYRVLHVLCFNAGPATSLTTATAGLFTATGGGGVAIAANQALSAITQSADDTVANGMQLTAANAPNTRFADTTLFVRVGTAQGASAFGDFYVFIQPLP